MESDANEAASSDSQNELPTTAVLVHDNNGCRNQRWHLVKLT
jgi:hypothetical protein